MPRHYQVEEVKQSTFKKEFGLIMVGAIIFTASFLWKDLLTDFKDKYFPKARGLSMRVIYTILITIIMVIIAVNLKNTFGLIGTTISFDDSPINGGLDTGGSGSGAE